MVNNQSAARWIAVTGCAASGVLVMAGGIWVVSRGLGSRDGLLNGSALFIGGLVVLLVGFLLFWNGVMLAIVREEERREGRDLEKRAEREGLPTEPEAYQDGGLGVAATAWRLDEAELIASMLRGQGISAWVEGAATVGWYWHMQFAFHPGGIRILVPMGRLADAQAIIAEHTKERAAQPGVEAEAETEDPGAALHQSARRLAYLLLIGPIAPVVFVLAIRLLVKIRRQRLASGLSADLRKARRLALVTAVLAGPGWGVFFGVVCISIIRTL